MLTKNTAKSTTEIKKYQRKVRKPEQKKLISPFYTCLKRDSLIKFKIKWLEALQ